MNMPPTVVVLVVTLLVTMTSLGAAVTADALARRPRKRVPDRIGTAELHPRSTVFTAPAGHPDRRWHHIATRAWAICASTSALLVAFVGILILIG